MTHATWLADVLRAAGLNVVERDGWKDRGRPGTFGPVRGVLCHHTGPTSSTLSATLLIENGRPDLPGPLSQLMLDKDGTFHVIAAGRCNHAGAGSWQGVTTGNSSFIGIEARNDGGGEVWPPVQLAAYERGVAAILTHLHADAVMAAGHKEYALPKGRKPDPTFDMVHFRENVETIMRGATPTTTPATTDPARSMLRKGDSGESVKQLQGLLKINPDGDFGPVTEAAVRAFQTSKALVADGRVGPKTWAALGIK